MLHFGTQCVDGRGHLTIGECDTVELARRFGTPLYVLDEALIRDNCRRYLRAFHRRFPDVEVAYSGKALLTKAICKIVESEGLALDVCSLGELQTALAVDFPVGRINMHGNYKLDEEIDLAVSSGVGRIIADCLPELERISDSAARHGTTARVMIRVRPGIKAHTHEYIQTGHEDNKFGLGLPDGEALSGAQRAMELPHLELVGVHCHVGSQIFALECFERAAEVMLGFMAEVREATGLELAELNLGGGLGIQYTHEDTPPSLDHLAEVICGAVATGAEKHGLPVPRLMLEPGRSIVGEAGTTLYRVGVVKHIPGIRTYVAVDGGLSDNPRPALYQAEYEAVVANKAHLGPLQRVRVSGRHCETDTLIESIALQPVEPGDILAVFSTGAYNYSMASNYNRFPRPAVVLVQDGEADIIVERETAADLLRFDRVPARLEAAREAAS